MEPLIVTMIIFVLVFTCCISYYWFIPESIDSTKKSQNQLNNDNIGYWGEVTGDFNWCEYNYQHTYYIAEPMNTFSSLFFCIGVALDYKYRFASPNYLLYLMASVFLMGVGSTLFHGTLKYEMQLLDEIPMYILAGFGSVVFYTRNVKDLNQSMSYKIGFYYQFGVALLMWITCLFTTKDNIFHKITRLYMNSFLLYFVYVFIAANNAANDLDKKLKNNMVSMYFAKSFIYFIYALTCWLLDNFACYNLQNLPGGIPYLHLHSFGWHLGVTLGLHHLFMMMLIHNNVTRLGNKYKIKSKSIVCGLVCYLEIIGVTQ